MVFSSQPDWRALEKTTDEALCLANEGLFYNHIFFGISMLVPVLLSTLFIIPHWLREEKPKKRLLKTLPLILFQLYPQFKAAEILYTGLFKKDRLWKSKKEAMQKEFGCLGTSLDNYLHSNHLYFF